MLRRAGHTEASVDLARLAGLYPGGVLCEIVNEDGTMSRMPDLEVFAEEHGLLIISIADLIRYRRITEQLVHPSDQSPHPDRLRGVHDRRLRESTTDERMSRWSKVRSRARTTCW